MDSVVHAALEEICCEASEGLYILNLWTKLTSCLASCGFPLCANVKRGVWENLVQFPGLKFVAGESIGSCDSTEDWGKRTVEECEEMNVKIVAPEDMRKSFLGIYELEALEPSLSDKQRLILQRLTVARTNGIAQSELAKEINMEPKNLFYPLKRLELLGLIVRLPAMVRTNQASKNKEPKIDSIVHTNMLYLFRYAKHLGCQQRLEISKENSLLTDTQVGDGQDEIGDDFGEEIEKEDIHVKDFLPALEAICTKLEKTEGKVLVISDIKRDLGYRGTSGHRSWRNICRRLKEAQVVEECSTMINKKMVICLRLLKKFSPSYFKQKINRRWNNDAAVEQSVSSVKRGQITNQLVELPILRQIYDMIDAAGSKGLTNAEVCSEIGLGSRDYHKRYFNQRIFRFGLHSKREIHNRSEVYRLYTAGNLNPGSSSKMAVTGKETNPKEVGEPSSDVLDLENVTKLMQLVDTSTSTGKVKISIESKNDASIITEASNDKNVDVSVLLLQSNPQNSDFEVPDEELPPASNSVTNTAQLEKSPPGTVTPPRRRSHEKFPSLTANATSLEREQRILKMLKEEKFLIKPELHRRLESLKKENKAMDRKTLDRSLDKLEEDGHLKCIVINVPAVTNCNRTRTTKVILHPSVCEISTELLCQKIYDKLRDFEIQLRKQANLPHRKSQSVAILDNVQRTPINVQVDVQSDRAELMRATGFVMAKMVRTKLLHVFLWGWVSSSPGWNDALLFSNRAHDLKNMHNTYKLFEIDVAIKSMPLELFLQVVGSAQKFEDMVEKCRSGLKLSDLPMHEYKCLMDKEASARLSRLIEILQHLKLLRLVSKSHPKDQLSSQDTTFSYAFELIPYIEEPASNLPSSDFLSLDIRPQFRHDFLLSSRSAVDEYWNTLEYCYAASKSQAALLAFPGSAVPEVFQSRAWASARVMTAGQRAELLKRVTKDGSSRKLPFGTCENIAKDLNLTLEQVLRFYYDRRQHGLNKLQRILGCEGKKGQPQRKRKRNSDIVASKRLKAAGVNGQSRAEAAGTLFHSDEKFNEEREYLLTPGEDYDCQLQNYYSVDDIDDLVEPGPSKDKKACLSIHKVLSGLNRTREKRFSWTEEADRKLVIAYARGRALVSTEFNRVGWSSITNLPASRNACIRRMSVLNSCTHFRKAVLKLSMILAHRYVKYIEMVPDKILIRVDSKNIVPENKFEGNQASECDKWDDFHDNKVKAALDDVLRYKRMAKLEAVKEFSGRKDKDFEDCGTSAALNQRSSSRRKLVNKVSRVGKRMHESLAIANAVELFKLIFLSSPTVPNEPTLVAKTLRRYSEHDLFSAFNYLKEKKIMIGGSSSPFVLSQQFVQSISPSTFPSSTGKRAARFVSWLHEREKKLVEEGVDLPSDLLCGEVFALCALVSSGELVMTPCLPDEGVGETEESKSFKRKYDHNNEPDIGEISKKLKTFAGEGENIARKEKGFPGIKLSVHYERISRLLAIESFKDESLYPTRSFSGKDQVNVDHVKEIFDSCGSNHVAVDMSESPWEAMTSFARYLISSCSYEVKSLFLHPDIFRTLYIAIQESGDQGLSMIEIHEFLNIEDEKILEIVIEVLETFGRALKVNGYDSIHVVDSLYRSKYFLTSVPDSAITHLKVHESKNKDEPTPDNRTDKASTSGKETNMISEISHSVTVLNQQIITDPSEISSEDKMTGYKHSEVASSQINGELEIFKLDYVDSLTCRPLLPWINGDGTTNELVYNRLRSRVLGIVMQNPGILEDGIINQLHCLNPQSCKKLLEILIMDNHIFSRKMYQTASSEIPSILSNLLGVNGFRKSKKLCRVHYFGNPMSTSLL